MIVEVLYFAEFKDITGKEKEKFTLSDITLEGLLNLLLEKYELKNLIWDEKAKKIHNLVSIIINNQHVHKKRPDLLFLENLEICKKMDTPAVGLLKGLIL